MKHLRIGLLLTACLLATTMFAQQNPPAKEGGEQVQGHQKSHQMPSADELLKELTTKLDLTADQQAKVKPIIDEHLKQMAAIRSDQSLSKEQSHAKAQNIHNDLQTRVRELLTDDQKKKLDAMMQEHDHAHSGTGSDKH